jgi:hypothetical protein
MTAERRINSVTSGDDDDNNNNNTAIKEEEEDHDHGHCGDDLPERRSL